jgi:nucleotide-binding universal stress UspA family protein
MTRKILCAIDNSEPGRTALLTAAELARETGADLEVAMVNAILAGSRGPPVALYEDGEVDWFVARAAALAKTSGARNVSSTVLRGSDIARALVRHADETGADHIVTGTRGKGALARLLTGSVAADVVNMAHCPVTVAR